MKKYIHSILSAALILFTGCSASAQTDKYEFRRTSANGQSWTKPEALTVKDSVLTLDSTGAPVFAPRSEFASPSLVTSASAALTAAIATKQNASPALSKIGESGGQPMWNGAAWPGGTGGAAGLPLVGIGASITNPPDTLLLTGEADFEPKTIRLDPNGIKIGLFGDWTFLRFDAANGHIECRAGDYIEFKCNGYFDVSTQGTVTFQGSSFWVKTYDPIEFNAQTGGKQRVKGADAEEADDFITKRQLDAAIQAILNR